MRIIVTALIIFSIAGCCFLGDKMTLTNYECDQCSDANMILTCANYCVSRKSTDNMVKLVYVYLESNKLQIPTFPYTIEILDEGIRDYNGFEPGNYDAHTICRVVFYRTSPMHHVYNDSANVKTQIYFKGESPDDEENYLLPDSLHYLISDF